MLITLNEGVTTTPEDLAVACDEAAVTLTMFPHTWMQGSWTKSNHLTDDIYPHSIEETECACAVGHVGLALLGDDVFHVGFSNVNAVLLTYGRVDVVNVNDSKAPQAREAAIHALRRAAQNLRDRAEQEARS